MEVGFIRCKCKCIDTFRKAPARDKLLLGALAFFILAMVIITLVCIIYFVVTKEYVWGLMSHINTCLLLIASRVINTRLRIVRKRTHEQHVENIELGSETAVDPEEQDSADSPSEDTQKLITLTAKEKSEGDHTRTSSKGTRSLESTQDEQLSASSPSDPIPPGSQIVQSKSEHQRIQAGPSTNVPRSISEPQSLQVKIQQRKTPEASVPQSIQTRRPQRLSLESVYRPSLPETQVISGESSSVSPLSIEEFPTGSNLTTGSSLTNVTPLSDDPLAIYLSSGSSLSLSTSTSGSIPPNPDKMKNPR